MASPRHALLKAEALARRAELERQHEGPPLRARSPFAKQTTRATAVHGKLLEDLQMTRVLLGKNMMNDVSYEVNDTALSGYHNYGACRDFLHQRGRVPMHKQGTRAAAGGTFESHWSAQAPPSIDATRPKRPSSGPAFVKQTTRLQDVNRNVGPEYYPRAYDSMETPIYTSSRPRVGKGTLAFAGVQGRVALNKVGTRAAAAGQVRHRVSGVRGG